MNNYGILSYYFGFSAKFQFLILEKNYEITQVPLNLEPLRIHQETIN